MNNFSNNDYIYDSEDPFKNDILGDRRQFAEDLNNLIRHMGDNAVISINSEWGEGKTTFINCWLKSLNRDEDTLIINAFEHDFQGDAFTAIFPMLKELFYKEGLGLKALNKFKEFTKKGAPILAGGLSMAAISDVHQASLMSKSVHDFTKIIVDSILSDKVDKTVYFHLKELNEAMVNFMDEKRKEADFKPFIVVIDELDRCRPTFAIEILEKIKHFFSVPGITWVLAINQTQISESIKHIYGTSEPDLYLQKFIDIQTQLPKEVSLENSENHYKKVISQWFGNDYSEIAVTVIVSIFKHYNLSLRELKKVSKYHFLISSKNDCFLSFLLSSIYMKDQRLFNRLSSGDLNTEEIISHFGFLLNKNTEIEINVFAELHLSQFNDVKEYHSEVKRYHDSPHGRPQYSPESLLDTWRELKLSEITNIRRSIASTFKIIKQFKL